jgi:hypothetical protein
VSAEGLSGGATAATRRLSLLGAAARQDHAFLGADDCCAQFCERRLREVLTSSPISGVFLLRRIPAAARMAALPAAPAPLI